MMFMMKLASVSIENTDYGTVRSVAAGSVRISLSTNSRGRAISEVRWLVDANILIFVGREVVRRWPFRDEVLRMISATGSMTWSSSYPPEYDRNNLICTSLCTKNLHGPEISQEAHDQARLRPIGWA